MSCLTDFYDGGQDCEGRTLWYILAQNDSYLEFGHDWVQWLFPLPEPSNFNPDAPILTEDDIKLFYANPKLQENLRQSFNRFITFLGMDNGSYNKVIFSFPNHNWFRITRVLRSLSLLGLKDEAQAFFMSLKHIHEKEGQVSDNSFSYWEEAVKL